MDAALQTLLTRLKEGQKSCEDKCLDLKLLKFESKDGEMRLYDNFRSYFFKYDPKNPKDAKVVYAARQFCKVMGVPYSFFAKNPSYMKGHMTDCWIPSMKTEKAQILARLRKTKDDYVIRALLPVEFTNISNATIVESIAEAIGDDFRVEFIIGDERDDAVLHIRFISNNEFDAFGEKCSVGFSVIMSELGGAPLSVDTFLYRVASKASFVASYSHSPFFQNDYVNILPENLKEMFPQLVKHLKEKLHFLKDKIQEAKEALEKKEDIKELMKSLFFRKELNERFHQALAHEIEKDESIKNLWEFTNKISIIAKDFDVVKRVKIERVAGDLLGLNFEG